MEGIEEYMVRNVVKVRRKIEGVESRLTEQWKYSTSVVKKILEKESERTVELDLLLAQNKNKK